jgi:hypothetical protein
VELDAVNRLYTTVKMIWQVLRTAPGKAITVQVTNALGEDREIEYYQLPGISAGPTPEDRAATIDMQGYRVAIASHNYRVEVETEAGALTIYSTNATGDTVQARIDLDTAGNIDLNGSARTLVTHAELDMALQGLVNALNLHTHPDPASGTSGPPSAPLSLDISAAEAATVRTA